jgi:hypothetical protein
VSRKKARLAKKAQLAKRNHNDESDEGVEEVDDMNVEPEAEVITDDEDNSTNEKEVSKKIKIKRKLTKLTIQLGRWP